MSATLISPATHWVDDGSDSMPLTPMVLVATGRGTYTFATRARLAAGSLVARLGGGYTLTIGVVNGSGIVAQGIVSVSAF